MTWNEWLEVVKAIETEWPNANHWPAETVKTAFERLRTCDPSDVWSGVHRFFTRGSKWPPEPSEVYALTKEAAVERARYHQPERRALPEPKVSLKEWLAREGFPTLRDALEAPADRFAEVS